MALLAGFILICLLGVAHHFGLVGLHRVTANAEEHPSRSMILTFWGLLLLHTAEILAFAGIYRVLLAGGWFGEFGGKFDSSWNGLIYFSGINYVTLGYTRIEVDGPLRMVNMMQSLGGFMVLTWSATFIYSIWAKAVDHR